VVDPQHVKVPCPGPQLGMVAAVTLLANQAKEMAVTNETRDLWNGISNKNCKKAKAVSMEGRGQPPFLRFRRHSWENGKGQ